MKVTLFSLKIASSNKRSFKKFSVVEIEKSSGQKEHVIYQNRSFLIFVIECMWCWHFGNCGCKCFFLVS